MFKKVKMVKTGEFVSTLAAAFFIITATACGAHSGQEAAAVEQESQEITIVETEQSDNTIIQEDKLKESVDIQPILDTELDRTYEYYLSKEELLADIEEGYIFRMDKTFHRKITPFVSEGNWSFKVHEDNTINLEIAYSNLFTWANKNIFPNGEMVVVDIFSPEGENAYHFEKLGDEILNDTILSEQILVTPGEWNLKISFAYVCRGSDTPSHIKIAAAYNAPSQEDIDWLREEQIGRASCRERVY